MDQLYNARMVQNANCLLCGVHEETNAHLFLHCKTTFEVWSYFMNSFELVGFLQVTIEKLCGSGRTRKLRKVLKDCGVFAVCHLVEYVEGKKQ